MKYTISIAAMAGVALAHYSKVGMPIGTSCTKYKDCKDLEKMCCGVMTNGKMCFLEDCHTTRDGVFTPNLILCNNKNATYTESYIIKQEGAETMSSLYAKYPSDSFYCLPGNA